MMSVSDDTQTEVTEAFNSTSRSMDDLLILTILILKKWLVKCIRRIATNTSDTEASFLD